MCTSDSNPAKQHRDKDRKHFFLMNVKEWCCLWWVWSQYIQKRGTIYSALHFIHSYPIKSTPHQLFTMNRGRQFREKNIHIWPLNGPVGSCIHQPQQPKQLLILVHIVFNLWSFWALRGDYSIVYSSRMRINVTSLYCLFHPAFC